MPVKSAERPVVDAGEPRRRFRMTVRRLMILVATMALGFACCSRLLGFLASHGIFAPEGTQNGPYTDLLPAGQCVVIATDSAAFAAGDVIKVEQTRFGPHAEYQWPDREAAGTATVSAGTRGIVRMEPAWDDDSAYDNRAIAVEILDGPLKAITLAIPRNRLRRP